MNYFFDSDYYFGSPLFLCKLCLEKLSNKPLSMHALHGFGSFKYLF